MPITQNRMLALLSEFDETCHVLEHLKAMILMASAQHKRGAQKFESIEDCLRTIEALINAHPIPHNTAKALEEQRFRFFGRRNERNRERMARKRAHKQNTDRQHWNDFGRPFNNLKDEILFDEKEPTPLTLEDLHPTDLELQPVTTICKHCGQNPTIWQDGAFCQQCYDMINEQHKKT